MTTRPSIERRVVVGSTLAVALTIAVSAVAVLEAYRAQDRRSGEEALRSVLEVGAERVVAESIFAERRGEATFDPSRPGLPPDFSWVAWRAGEPGWLARSEGFPDLEVSRGQEDPVEGEPGSLAGLRYSELVDASGARFRAATASFLPRRRVGPNRGPGDGPMGRRERDRRPPRGGEPPFREGERFVVLALTPIQTELERASELTRLLGLAALGALVASALLIRSSVRRGMAPLGALSARIEGMGTGHLDDPVTLPSAPAELAPIVDALERSRARLAESFARERRFTDDAAHELRTPLAGLRASLEVALRRERSAEELVEVAEGNLASTLELQQIVDSLLLLRRSRDLEGDAVPVDLRQAIDEAFGERSADLSARGLELDGGERDEALPPVAGDPDLVRRIATNLAGNAAAHAAPDTTVRVRFEPAPAGLRLTVENDAVDLPADAARHAFEPFWRAESARSADGAHLGLGLAIVRSCAEAMGGEAEATSEGGVFRITVTLPLHGTP